MKVCYSCAYARDMSFGDKIYNSRGWRSKNHGSDQKFGGTEDTTSKYIFPSAACYNNNIKTLHSTEFVCVSIILWIIDMFAKM